MRSRRQRPTDPEVEAAIAVARDWIAGGRVATDFNVYGAPLQFLGKEAGRDLIRRMMKQLTMSHPFRLLQTIDAARQGERVADEVLRELIAEHVGTNTPLPPQLAAYNIEVCYHGRPAVSRGPRREDRFLRDLCLATVVAYVVERFAFRPTRGRGSSRPSASWIVAEAWAREHMRPPFDDKRVEKAWQRFGWATVANNRAEKLIESET
jgi:hypothetical protein